MPGKLTLDRETFKVLAADTRIEILKKLQTHKLTLTDLAQQMDMSPSTVSEHLERLVEVSLIMQEDKGMKWKYYKLTEKGRNILSPQETKVWILLGTTILVFAAASISLLAQLPLLASAPAHYATLERAVLPQPEMSASQAKAAGGVASDSAVTSSTEPPSNEPALDMVGALRSAQTPPTTIEKTAGAQEESGGTQLMSATSMASTTSTTSSTTTTTESTTTTTTMSRAAPVATQVASPLQFPWPEAVLAVASLVVAIMCIVYLMIIRRNRVI